jgi:DNA-binding response OmpR family regulator
MARIIVVEDEPDIATLVKKALEAKGFDVDVFTDSRRALDHFKPNYYAMLITDIRMPGMNGFELYRQVKKIDEKINVAFMTAFEIYESEFRKVMPNIDVRFFFKKPVRMQELVAGKRSD